MPEDKSILASYEGSDEEKTFQANVDIINQRAKQAVQNEATLLVFPEDAFVCPEASSGKFIEGHLFIIAGTAKTRP